MQSPVHREQPRSHRHRHRSAVTSVPESRPHLLFTEGSQRAAYERLIQQQFWLWGCDVRRPEGNLLALHGFAKMRPPADSRCTTSRYTAVIPGGIDLALWGFGLLARRGEDAVFLPRLSARPRCGTCGAPLDGRWDPDDFPEFRRPASGCDHRLVQAVLADVFRWLASYERHVLDIAGASYRAGAIAAWKRPIGAAQELPARWAALADALDAEMAAIGTA
ncbi:MAG TPA: hypothetical protein VNP95_03185 [Thermomicrobiales bacterium]|nr:hypothetical protein [Thermomicrobiales bacterium]